MAAEAHAPTASEYIVHHLQHLQNIQQTSIIDMSVINYDSVVVSVLIGFLGVFIFWLAARKATTKPKLISTTPKAASSLLRWR